jgi:hypothetical protein
MPQWSHRCRAGSIRGRLYRAAVANRRLADREEDPRGAAAHARRYWPRVYPLVTPGTCHGTSVMSAWFRHNAPCAHVALGLVRDLWLADRAVHNEVKGPVPAAEKGPSARAGQGSGAKARKASLTDFFETECACVCPLRTASAIRPSPAPPLSPLQLVPWQHLRCLELAPPHIAGSWCRVGINSLPFKIPRTHSRTHNRRILHHAKAAHLRAVYAARPSVHRWRSACLPTFSRPIYSDRNLTLCMLHGRPHYQSIHESIQYPYHDV